MRNTCWADLEGLAHELVLRVDLAVVPPCWGFSPAGRDRRMVADLFRDVAVLLVVSYILECLALRDCEHMHLIGELEVHVQA